MKVKNIHTWDVSLRDARILQDKLRRRIVLKDDFKNLHCLAGCDIAIDPINQKAFAAVIVYSWPELREIERSRAVETLRFPYVPGFLSFREGPPLLKAISVLKKEPDLFIFDGQGIAHPRGLGIAAHLGLFLDKPTVGCAKSRLFGTFQEPGLLRGDQSPLGSKNGQRIGSVLRTRDGVKPVFVSPGHKISLQTACKIILKCCDGYRIPKPTREADQYADILKREQTAKPAGH